MSYRVEVSFAPANELIISLHLYLCKKSHRRLELAPNWPADTRKLLTPDFAAKLAVLDHLEEWGHLQLLVSRCPQAETTEGFLDWYGSLTVGEIYEHLSPWVQYFPVDLGELRDRHLALLTEWDAQYFRHLDPAILARLQEDAEEKREWCRTMEPSEVVERATNGLYFEPQEGLEKLLLIPQYHGLPLSYLNAYRGLSVCWYGAHNLPLQAEEEPSPALYRITRSLADKTRLKILRYLRDEPRSFADVVKHLGMAKSTVYEHLLNLRSAGLISATVNGEASTFYKIRPAAFDQLHGLLKDYVE
jgi:DNA-binding transcriptional ArsR family regulator